MKEKAKKLQTSLPKDIPSGTKSRNILAMTFRQVVLEQLWNFELLLFSPGTERNTEEFENAREVRYTSSFLYPLRYGYFVVMSWLICLLAGAV